MTHTMDLWTCGPSPLLVVPHQATSIVALASASAPLTPMPAGNATHNATAAAAAAAAAEVHARSVLSTVIVCTGEKAKAGDGRRKRCEENEENGETLRSVSLSFTSFFLLLHSSFLLHHSLFLIPPSPFPRPTSSFRFLIPRSPQHCPPRSLGSSSSSSGASASQASCSTYRSPSWGVTWGTLEC